MDNSHFNQVILGLMSHFLRDANSNGTSPSWARQTLVELRQAHELNLMAKLKEIIQAQQYPHLLSAMSSTLGNSAYGTPRALPLTPLSLRTINVSPFTPYQALPQPNEQMTAMYNWFNQQLMMQRILHHSNSNSSAPMVPSSTASVVSANSNTSDGTSNVSATGNTSDGTTNLSANGNKLDRICVLLESLFAQKAQNQEQTPLCPDGKSHQPPTPRCIVDLLHAVNLTQYEQILLTAGCQTEDDLWVLDDTTLRFCGIKNSIHRRRILQQIQQMKHWSSVDKEIRLRVASTPIPKAAQDNFNCALAATQIGGFLKKFNLLHYTTLLLDAGFEQVDDLKHITGGFLNLLGVKNKQDREELVRAIQTVCHQAEQHEDDAMCSFLKKHGLEEYQELLAIGGYDRLEDLHHLTDSLLVIIGMKKVGHRQRLLNAISGMEEGKNPETESTASVPPPTVSATSNTKEDTLNDWPLQLTFHTLGCTKSMCL